LARICKVATRREDVTRFWRDPDLAGIEVRFSRRASAALGRHTHDAYSVGIVTEGQTVSFLRGRDTPIGKGQAALVHPHELHSCNPRDGAPLAYWMFHVDLGWLSSLAQELSGRAETLPAFRLPVVDDPVLFGALEGVGRLVERRAERLEKESVAAAAFAALLQRHCRVSPQPLGPSRRAVRLAQELIEASLTQNLSLVELAEAVGLSRYHLLRVFKQSTGLPPHAWRAQRRGHMARRLLSSGMSITDAALESGFADQSHLSHWFKRMVGTTPRQYLLRS